MRMFVAMNLTPNTLEWLADLEAELRPTLPGWRWLRPESLHVTLRFLGEVDEAQDAAARGRFRAAVGSRRPFRLRLTGVGAFPPRGQPRVLWVGLESDPADALAELASGIELAARDAGFEPEKRPFRGHITVGRARGSAARPANSTTPSEWFAREAVSLFRSELLPSGARYTLLEAMPLAGSGAGVSPVTAP